MTHRVNVSSKPIALQFSLQILGPIDQFIQSFRHWSSFVRIILRKETFQRAASSLRENLPQAFLQRYSQIACIAICLLDPSIPLWLGPRYRSQCIQRTLLVVAFCVDGFVCRFFGRGKSFSRWWMEVYVRYWAVRG